MDSKNESVSDFFVRATITTFSMRGTHVRNIENDNKTLMWFNSAGGGKNYAAITIDVCDNTKTVAKEINDFAVKIDLVYADDEKTKVTPKPGKHTLFKIPADLHLTNGSCEAKCKILAVTRSYDGKKFAIRVSVPALKNISCIAESPEGYKHFYMKTKTKTEIAELRDRKIEKARRDLRLSKSESSSSNSGGEQAGLSSAIPASQVSFQDTLTFILEEMRKMQYTHTSMMQRLSMLERKLDNVALKIDGRDTTQSSGTRPNQYNAAAALNLLRSRSSTTSHGSMLKTDPQKSSDASASFGSLHYLLESTPSMASRDFMLETDSSRARGQMYLGSAAASLRSASGDAPQFQYSMETGKALDSKSTKKRKRGRPRKYPRIDGTKGTTGRPRGRPRKHPLPAGEATKSGKRPRGRPRKNPVPEILEYA